MIKKTFKKTRKVYLEQHKTFFKNNELFDRFYSYAVEPKNYCLKKNFFKNANVLDAGCGNSGYFVKAMLDLGANHVYCLDLGKKWIKSLKKGLKEKNVPLSKISFVSGSVTNLPFKSESMDFVACNGVLYHLPNINSASKSIKELFRVTKYGGSVFAYFGVDKPGLIEKYIQPAFRNAYLKEKSFKNFIDNGNLLNLQKNLNTLAEVFLKNDNIISKNSLKKFIKLFNSETIMFMQDCLQVPINQSIKLNKQYALKILKKIGAKNIRSPKDFYFKRTDIRRFLTPLHVTKKNNDLSKILYGEHLKFTFDKI